MSFNIHASGQASGGQPFLYTRRRCADGDVFEATAVMSAIQATSPSRLGVAEGVGDYVLPSVAGDVRAGAQAHGATIWRQRLVTAFSMLATNPHVAQGWIGVSAVQSTLGIRRSSAVRRYNFSSRGSVSAHAFLQTVMPVLTQTNMNNYGVLREITNAIWAFRNHIGPNGRRPMLSIQLHG